MEDSKLNTQKVGGLVFLDLILILSFTLLNTEVAAIAAAGTTAIETLLATLFPYVMVFVILVFTGVTVNEAIK